MGDGKEHSVELLAVQQNFTLKVDGGPARSMINAGKEKFINIDAPLFLGGVPAEVAKHARSLWHLRNTTSFTGMDSSFDFD